MRNWKVALLIPTLLGVSIAFAQSAEQSAVVAVVTPSLSSVPSAAAMQPQGFPKRQVGQVCTYHETDKSNPAWQRDWVETVLETTNEKTVIRIQTDRGFHDRWFNQDGNLISLFTLSNKTQRVLQMTKQYYRWPLAVGSTWEVKDRYPMQDGNGYSWIREDNLTAEVKEAENISVGGQTFKAYRIVYSGMFTDTFTSGWNGASPSTYMKEEIWLSLEAPCPVLKYTQFRKGYNTTAPFINLTRQLTQMGQKQG